jgi:CSLREA domain-containing protein
MILPESSTTVPDKPATNINIGKRKTGIVAGMEKERTMFNRILHIIVFTTVLASLFATAPVKPAHAAGIVVNSDADSVANDGVCTLREAINSANSDLPSGGAAGECAAGSGADTITFAGNYTITLGSQLPGIFTDITINGNGSANTIVQAHALPNTATDRILYVNGGNVTINGTTLRNGRCSGGCTGPFSTAAGGVMIANGSFTLQDSNLEGNHASQGGGALFIYSANASATILNSSVSNNSSGAAAGGIYMNEGTLIVENSAINSNNTVTTGGGLYTLNASVTVENSIFSGNSSASGGGAFLSNNTTAAFSEVTFSGNSVTSSGGGLQSQTGSLDLTNVTFDGNSVTSATSAHGGGLYISSNSPMLSNVTFSGNTVTGIAGTHGGGMYSEQASPVMNQVVFSNNAADGPINNSFGGGLSISQGSPIIENATFIENSSAFNGGGLYSNGSNMTVTNTSIEMNTAIDGGGVYLNTGSPTLENVLVKENTATNEGGGLYMFADADINTTTFDSNEAIYGGGMYSISNFNATIRNSLFKSNTAVYGGGVLNQSANTAFTNLTFHGNNGSSYGGGMYNYLSSPSLMNTTFSANNATQGGAIFNDGNSDPTVTNSIFWGNTYNEIYVYDVASAPVVTYSVVQGGGLYPGAGNLNTNPNLEALADNGGATETMSLGAGSSAINNGTNINCPSTDQRGYGRADGNCDIGSYEHFPPIVLTSTAAEDGWILESSETSGKGGTIKKNTATLNIGDDAANKQYRAILSFDTSSLPANAVITAVTLNLKYAGKKGTLPFKTHGNLLADIQMGAFKNNAALQLSDFKAGASQTGGLSFTKDKLNDWYSQTFNAADFQYINPIGVTQIRLRFTKDDNNDFGADFLKIYSGNAAEADRPQLIIEYYVP